MKRSLIFLLLAGHLLTSAQRMWQPRSTPPFAGRYAHVSFVIGDHAYAGLGSVNAEDRIYSAEIYRYDPIPDTWTRLADFPGGKRFGACAFSVNGKGYICTGVDSTHQWRNDVWEFDPVTESWTQKSPFPGGARYNSSAFVTGGYAYLVAGSYNAGFDYLKDLWRYDPATDTWERKADLPVMHKSGPVTFALNGHGYAGGGADNTYQTARDFYEYDPADDTWNPISNMPQARSGALGFVVGDTAYVGTGTDLNVTFNSFIYMTVQSGGWIPAPVPPAGFSERLSGTAFTIGNTAYVLAGRDRPYDPFYDPGTLLHDFWAYTFCTLPVADFAFEVHNRTVAFHDTSTGATGYGWIFGDGSYSADKDPVHTYLLPGSYTVCHASSNECGEDTVCKTVVIACPEPEARIGFTVNFPDVQFTDLSVTGTLISRLWDFGDSTWSTEADPLHTYSQPGNYTVCLTVADSCGTDSVCGTLSLLLPMTLQVSAVPAETNDLLAVFADNTPETTYWHWDFGDGSTSEQKSPVHLYKDYGAYRVCLTAGNAISSGSWCDTLRMTVNPSLHLAEPVNVYPIPSSGMVHVRFFRDCSETDIRLYDFTGSEVRARHLSGSVSGTVGMDLTGFPAGVYLMRVTCDQYDRIWKIVVL